MSRIFETTLDEIRKTGGTFFSHFISNSLPEYYKSVHAYLRLIIMKNLPLNFVEDREVRKYSRFGVRPCPKTINYVIFKLVEHQISEEMKGKICWSLFYGCFATKLISLP